MPKLICRCCGPWPSLGLGRCGDENALAQRRRWLLSAPSPSPGLSARVGGCSVGELAPACPGAWPPWSLDQRVGAQLGAGAPADKLAAAGAALGGGATLRPLLFRRVAVHIYTPEEKAALLAATRQLCPPESL